MKIPGAVMTQFELIEGPPAVNAITSGLAILQFVPTEPFNAVRCALSA